jgi:hypothetical protein
MSRRHFSALLVAAIVVVLAVALLVPGRTGREEPPAAGPLLPDMGQRINDVNGLKVTLAGNQTVATLQRGEDGWQIAELAGYPADFDQLRGILAGLAEAKIQEYKTDNPEFYERLGVEDIGREDAAGILLELELGDESVGLIVGDEASGREGQFVRLAGEARSALIDRVLDVPADLVDWADRDIVDVGSYQVREVEIVHPDADRILARKAAATDTDFVLENLPEGREAISSWSVNSLASALSRLQMDSVRPAPDEAVADTVRVRVLTFDGVEYLAQTWTGEDRHWLRLEISVPAAQEAGEQAEADADQAEEVLAQAAEVTKRVAGWVYEIPASKHATMTKRLEDLLKQPEEPAAADG